MPNANSFNINEDLVIIKEKEVSVYSVNNSDIMTATLEQLNLTKKRKRQFNGFILMGLGAFLGFVSCLLTVTNPVPELYNIILYGLTTFAIIIIMWGLYFVFE